MAEIHCHSCGGFIGDPEVVSYRQPSALIPQAAPHAGLCQCEQAVVYGAPPGFVSWPGWSSIRNSRIAARN